VDRVVRRSALAVAVVVGLASGGLSAGAQDGSALAERLGTQPFDQSALQNGAQLADIEGSSSVADDLRPYGLVGVAFVRFENNTGSDAGTVMAAYYVFSGAAEAQAFPFDLHRRVAADRPAELDDGVSDQHGRSGPR